METKNTHATGAEDGGRHECGSGGVSKWGERSKRNDIGRKVLGPAKSIP